MAPADADVVAAAVAVAVAAGDVVVAVVVETVVAHTAVQYAGDFDDGVAVLRRVAVVEHIAVAQLRTRP